MEFHRLRCRLLFLNNRSRPTRRRKRLRKVLLEISVSHLVLPFVVINQTFKPPKYDIRCKDFVWRWRFVESSLTSYFSAFWTDVRMKQQYLFRVAILMDGTKIFGIRRVGVWDGRPIVFQCASKLIDFAPQTQWLYPQTQWLWLSV